MSKKTAVIAGIIVTLVIVATLFVNVVFSDKSENADIAFFNIEALAEEESNRIPQCIESGTICIGFDKNDLWSKHPGLKYNPDSWQE